MSVKRSLQEVFWSCWRFSNLCKPGKLTSKFIILFEAVASGGSVYASGMLSYSRFPKFGKGIYFCYFSVSHLYLESSSCSDRLTRVYINSRWLCAPQEMSIWHLYCYPTTWLQKAGWCVFSWSILKWLTICCGVDFSSISTCQWQ